jgi:uncharacterized protein YndB with AHSA1/START domain
MSRSKLDSRITRLLRAPFALDLASRHPFFVRIEERRCRDQYGLHFPSHSTLIMPKKTSHTPITSATHRLSLEIAKPHAAVWKAFTGDIHSWWPKDFYVTESPQRIVFEVKPGGRLYEDSGKGNGLVWYHVIALDAPNSITMSGFIAPPFGGPATSLLNVSFSARGKSATAMEVTDSTFGCLGDTSATAEGWRLLFKDGFKSWVEQRPKIRSNN